MCGIAGLVSASSDFDPVAARELGLRMASVLHHRGPDGGGVLVEPAHGTVLAHRRLAVVDLTAAGAQPMLSRSGRTAIVFNGEIYNFRELRTRLAGRLGIASWRGRGDCEVLVEAIETLGLDAALGEVRVACVLVLVTLDVYLRSRAIHVEVGVVDEVAGWVE